MTIKIPGTLLFSLIAMGVLSLLYAPQTSAQPAPSPNGTLPAESESLPASRDSTLYEDDEGELSNGAGPYLFAGRTGENADTLLRRAVLAFDLSTLPAGTTITNATLRLHVSKVPPGQTTHDFTLHRLQAEWGEGLSCSEAEGNGCGVGGQGGLAQSGDATWLHRFYEEDAASALLWGTPGGDFAAAPSATTNVGGPGRVRVVERADGGGCAGLGGRSERERWLGAAGQRGGKPRRPGASIRARTATKPCAPCSLSTT